MSDDNGWERHWAEKNTPWDAGVSAPPLRALIDEWKRAGIDPRGKSALVPGCGSGHDVFALAHYGFSTTGLDIAPSALPRFEELRIKERLELDSARLKTSDFFTAAPDEFGAPFDFIWDYTFYCAIDPESRTAWKTRMQTLLKPSGTLAMLLFPVDPSRRSADGPPYPIDPELVTKALTPELERVRFEKVTESHPGREGKEFLSLWKHKTD